jgi:hypothetical protein
MTEGRGISAKAVLLGALVDFGSSLAVGFVAGFIWVIALAAQGVPADEMIDDPPDGLPVIIPSLVLGFGATVLGGYVAGRIAKQAEVLHGGIVGAIGIPLGFVSALVSPAELPLWFHIVSFVGIVPVGMTGGFLAKRIHGTRPPAGSRL